MVKFTRLRNKLYRRSLLNRGAGGGDVIPNAISWDNLSYNPFNDSSTFKESQISGISQTITLKIVSQGGYIPYFYVRAAQTPSGFSDYIESGTASYQSSLGDGYFGGILDTSTGYSFSVANNDYIGFLFYLDTINLLDTVYVYNVSDANTLLATFYVADIS